MSDRSKSASPIPSQEEIDAAYSKARTSLDGRAAPFVPGVGRLSQDFNSIDLSSTSSPSDKSEPEAGYRRGSGGFVVRTHKYVPPLTAALGDNDVGVGGAKADTVFAMADAATDGSSIGDETKAKVSVSRRRSGSGSGGFVVRSHRNVAPLSSQVKISPEKRQEQGDTPTPSTEASSPPPPSLPTRPEEAEVDTQAKTPSPEKRQEQRDPEASPPLPSLPSRPEEAEVDTQAKTPSPEKRQEQGDPEASPPLPSLPSRPEEAEVDRQEQGKTSTPSTEAPSSPPPPVLPSRPEETEVDGDGSCDRGFEDAATEASAWEQASSSIVDGNDKSGTNSGSGSSSVGVSSVTVSPAETLDIRIFCGTWNVAGRKVDSVDEMGEWLDVDKLDDEGEPSDPPDLFVVGFQEVVELSAQNVVMDSFLDTQSRANSLHLFKYVYAYLAQYGQRHGVKYAMVSEQWMLGTYVLAMATEDLCAKIAHVQSAVVQTGLGGYFGNKGAVAVRMEIAGASSLCFVCVHMAAHREQLEARNNEYKLISSRAVFADTAGRLPADESEDTSGGDRDKDKRQANTWGSLFAGAGAGQGGRPGGMSPTRSSEVKKAIRAAMAFGLPKGGGGGGGGQESGGSSPTNGKDDETEAGGADKGTGGDDGGGDGPDEEEDFAWEPSVRHADAGLAKTKTVLQADVVFWLGDLNYRIAEDVPDEVVFEMLKSDNLEFLREKDQLNMARAAGEAFQEFQEGPLCFPPTYKYIPGTRDFDNRPEKKLRCPSWCDRVLYSVEGQKGNAVKRLGLDRYWSSGPLLSDHMPVSALFRTSLACAPETSVDEPEMQVEPLSPRQANAQAAFESSPFARVTLDPQSLEMLLDQKPLQTAAVTIANAGGVKGHFHVCSDFLPDWMRLEGDDRGDLGPGEKAGIGLVFDVAKAEAAAEKESNGAPGPRKACAMLTVEVDGGGSGTILPIECSFGDV